MPKRSAGLLMYRHTPNGIEVLLAHPGGPFWIKKDLGAWSIPKGEYAEEEEPSAAARREFQEETGILLDGELIHLGEQKQPGGKIISAWAIEGNCNPSTLQSNMFQMEWPPKSGKMAEFPEIDRWAWLSFDEARQRILKGQAIFLDRLQARFN